MGVFAIDLTVGDALPLGIHDAAAFKDVPLGQFYLLLPTGHRCKSGEFRSDARPSKTFTEVNPSAFS